MASSTYRYPVAVIIPVLSFLSIIISIPPFLLHWKNRNFPATLLIVWFLLTNVFNITNALLWPNDDTKSWWDGKGLCDFEVKIMIASYVGVPGAMLCIFRSLALVLDTDRATLVPSRSQRWRTHVTEILFCVAIPVLAMALQIVYQKNRYMLFAISGCINSFDESWVSLALSFAWPTIISFGAAYYCCVVIYRLHKYRSQFGDILSASSSKYNKSRFLRLFFLAATLLLGILPVFVWILYYNVTLSLPWHAYSWHKVHSSDWNTIYKIPTGGQAFFDRWIPIIASILIFVFFGFGRDATRLYRSCLMHLGVDRCLPSLSPNHARPAPVRNNSTASAAVSISSRARLLFHKRWTGGSRTYVDNSFSMATLGAGSVHTEKRSLATNVKSRSWLRGLFGRRLFSGTRNRNPSVLDLSAPTSTIRTNAWAEESQTRTVDNETDSIPSPGSEGFIRVKQVISQQSEMFV
ncbi:hypothetical protein ASPZODRAFT_61636 [Penicilliopsis zonata CBS 506.65]|uniref:A-pheromone receptor PreA n=1 Tax=Penicilliopsis zonata CBS 506.65 TaxID=1073090 RepID=A0A1L9SMD8_9EURO|nr:hypothetical protein ASPZODRAFT_61636 [Penicilliopsis zonata CBS 506.65]OJJ48261.1 hypothetical protein ASPZODRAFT_61636 [Penicilliopsis zonata CBS 506.65]